MGKLALLSALIVGFCFTNSFAVKGIGFGVRGGYVSGYDNPNLVGTTGKIDKLQMLGGHIQLGFVPVVDAEVSGEYAWKTENDIYPGVNLTYGDFSVNGSVTYPFPLPVVRPYVGVGLGFHRLVYSWDGTYGTGVLADDQTTLSFHGLAGISLGIPAAPVTFFLEGRYTSLQTDPEKTNYASILGGVTFGL